ncbi:GntR family transcriptional regulator [Polynucleobacter sp. VK25]|uniref:GntR family transcriptional regulator n=1 Tax=Polynucleobacter sp. VK25 TaxID=1758398 RepID=UPI001BFD287F|nr:GntR family transcriptional regulator [Polynucleobacter sp. VK25]QWD67797.1 GntR family transcriptional regulator [Polynucleobacter sp. VK25]
MSKKISKEAEICQRLEEGIKSGEYPIGAKLPTEEELCTSFVASRYSVRQALGSLVEAGLISRHKRAGSFVISTTRISQLIQSVGSIQQLLNYPSETIREVLRSEFITADHELAAILKCAPGDSWFHIESIRIPKGSKIPLCKTDIYVLPQFSGVIKHKKHEQIPIADQILEMYGELAESTQIDIVASNVDPKTAALLKVKKNSSALTVYRRYANAAGKIFEVGIGVHPSERYTYSFNFKRNG